jgi:reversibly glycosylated polypeptide/UDP-arabinopyranose mutase
MSVAVVVPSCRPDRLADFLRCWGYQFDDYNATVLVVRDDTPNGEVHRYDSCDVDRYEVVGDAASIMGDDAEIVPRQSPACRCIGFAWLAANEKHDAVVTLDDDLTPDGDTLGDHLYALSMRVPTSWMSSTSWGSPYMRGFPYGVRNESPVWVSHGVWQNIPDLDAPTQLVLGDSPGVSFYKGPVPKGVYFPVCGMNLAFRWEALPLMYWSPAKMLPGAERFDDIWMGIRLTRRLEKMEAALVTGFASCIHTRASNTFKNLEQEARGIGLNEGHWRHDGVSDAAAARFFEHDIDWAARWSRRMLADMQRNEA